MYPSYGSLRAKIQCKWKFEDLTIKICNTLQIKRMYFISNVSFLFFSHILRNSKKRLDVTSSRKKRLDVTSFRPESIYISETEENIDPKELNMA
jgi:hypothetical protein